MFVLDKTLAKDSVPISETPECLIRLINDQRFPWVLVVPKISDARELHDLDKTTYQRVMALVLSLGEAMKSGFEADKINTAAIGNMVPQLHIHVVARRTDDACWPAPIWGAGEMQRMNDDEIQRRMDILRSKMNFA